ncbi:oligosaccharide flippase family protein [Rufibacter aurantiacus]|uniref:oligosaccharide flippase family protein n=1 Tax=Rufibacter aurantiacus TaxID=2817374 RepID=UPI001B307ED5|nr:oligosaccharide flippase family protein [Rufibacter aurantiacus]
MSFKKGFFKNLLTVGGYSYSVQVINFLSSTIISRLLLPKDYGFFALITVFTGFVSIFANAGFGAAIIRGDYGETYYKALRNLSFMIGVSIFFIMLILAYPLALFYGNMELIIPTVVFSIVFIFRPLSIVPSAILRKKLDFIFLGQRDLYSTLLSVIITIILAYLGFTFWALIIPQIVAAVLNYLFIENKVKLGYKIYSWKYTVAGYRHTKSLMANVLGFNLVNYWARNFDNLLIGKMYGTAELGIYNRAYSLLTLPLNLISGVFGSILFPSLKKLVKDGGDYKKEYEDILSIISMLDFPIAVVLILFPSQLVQILWGDNWLMVAELLPYFGLMILTQGLVTTVGNIYYLLGKEKMNFYVGAVNAILMIAFIGIGAFFSVKDIVRVYALGYLLVNVPVNLYFGFVKSFGYDFQFIVRFWMPKIILSLLILFALWVGMYKALPILLLVYFTYLIVKNRSLGYLFYNSVLRKKI